MKILCLSVRIRRKRKHSSYHREVGKTVENNIQRLKVDGKALCRHYRQQVIKTYIFHQF